MLGQEAVERGAGSSDTEGGWKAERIPSVPSLTSNEDISRTDQIPSKGILDVHHSTCELVKLAPGFSTLGQFRLKPTEDVVKGQTTLADSWRTHATEGTVLDLVGLELTLEGDTTVGLMVEG